MKCIIQVYEYCHFKGERNEKEKYDDLLFVALLALAMLSGCSSSGGNDNQAAGNSANDDATFVVGLDDSFPPMASVMTRTTLSALMWT